MDQFNPIGHDYVNRNFNDRRLGAAFKSTQGTRGVEPHAPTTPWPKKGDDGAPGGNVGGVKPKGPKPTPHAPKNAGIRPAGVISPQRIR